VTVLEVRIRVQHSFAAGLMSPITVPEKRGPIWWLGIAVGISTAIATLVLANGIKLGERDHVRRLTRLALKAVQADLIEDVSYLVSAHMSLLEGSGPASAQAWRASANIHLSRHPDLIAVEWVDSSLESCSIVPEKLGDGHFCSSFFPQELLTPKGSDGRGEPMLTPVFHLPDGRMVRGLVSPMYKESRPAGFVVSIIDVRKSLERMLSNQAALGYSIMVSEAGQELYRDADGRGENADWIERATIQLPATMWEVAVWPRAELLAELKSNLYKFVLIAGSAFCVLLLAVTNLAQIGSTQTKHLQLANEKLQKEIAEREQAEARLAGILEISADGIISVDKNYQITLFNRGAEQIFGYQAAEVIGKSLDLLLPEGFRKPHREHVKQFGGQRFAAARMDERRPVFGRRKDGTEFPMEASISRLEVGGEITFTSIVRDITSRLQVEEQLRRGQEELGARVRERTAELAATLESLQEEIAERKQAEDSLRELSGHLLQLQDAERRRIARELHDSTAQLITALSLNLLTAKDLVARDPVGLEGVLEDSARLAEQVSNEIRTISYLLHPPLLDELGLDSALEWYVEGFSRRSGIEVDLDMADLGRAPKETELTLFRIVQEALTNVHRHSRCHSAWITLVRANGTITLSVSDDGIGVPVDSSRIFGVGIAGMRERVRQLGGSLQLESGSNGTVVTVVLPVSDLETLTAA
jgi:PAS domain S-box-containing protein